MATVASVTRPHFPSLAALAALDAEGRRRQPLLWGTALFFALIIAPTAAAFLIDPRSLYGVNVWTKPLKFEASLAVYFGTLAWFAGYLRDGKGDGRFMRGFTVAAVAAAVFEVGYMIVQSGRGVGSHFNTGTTVEAVLFPLMGLGALVITGLSLAYAVAVARSGRDNLAPAFKLAVVLGLALTCVLGTAAGVAISINDSHWVGGVHSDAGGLPIVGWARDGGDLRVAHLFGIHAMQIVPFAGWLIARRHPKATASVWLVAFLLSGITGLTFWEALLGRPFLGFLAY